MNVNDSERMYSLLEMQNYTPVQSPEQADLIIINSCSVREKPVHKVHSEVGKYRKLKEANPKLKIGVGGCVGQQEKKNLLKDIPVLDFVFGPDNIDELPQIVGKASLERVSQAKFHHQEPYEIETLVRNPGVATFVNITKGCDNFCTFCVVPFTRGRLRSRPDEEIVTDVKKLVDRGVKEVTLLGQNVNSYMSEADINFSKLLVRICKETGIERIRYTTSHPKDFDQELVDVMAEYRPRICDYIHLPVQHGNSEVLERMNRGYTREEYLAKAKMIFDALPGVSFSTDLIVGFPGETEDQFQETLSILDEVPYESIYAFKYSPRPFTKAARWEDQLSEEDKSRRLTQLIEKHREIAFNLVKRYDGQVWDILVEHEDRKIEGVVVGRTTTNKLVHFKGGKDLIGQTVPVKITRAAPQTLLGERVLT
ncbi:MAG: tRNA (N6-isopentenyl adenosine(37)-C2)-methylthiotransferase MiaB [Bdellovibrionales bacterium]|nr:tRNA (N6-isopentenyl adenosine(37)-C2)-methylthiotransferase MiaB [Bdellovibrionales bacterium]